MPDDLATAVRRWLIAAVREQASDPDHVIFNEALADDLDAAGVAYGPGELTAILQALAAQQRIELTPAGVNRRKMPRSGGWFITPLPALRDAGLLADDTPGESQPVPDALSDDLCLRLSACPRLLDDIERLCGPKGAAPPSAGRRDDRPG